MARNLFKRQAQNIRDFRRAANARTMGDYRAVGSQLDAIYGNLQTTGSSLRGRLTARQAKEMGAMDRIRNRNIAAGRRIVGNAERGMNTRYGTALGGAIHENLGVARATNSATRVSTLGQRRAGTILSNAGKDAMGIMQAGAAEAASSAEYARNVALRSRNQVTAEKAAEMQFELQQMKLDHRFAMAQMQKQYDLMLRNDLEMQKAQREELEPEINANLVRIQDLGMNSFEGLQGIFNSPLTGPDGQPSDQYPNAAQAAQAYAASMGYAPGTDQYMVIQAVANSMYAAGAGPTNVGSNPLGAGGLYGAGASPTERQSLVLDSVKETLMSLYPDYADLIDKNYSLMQSKAQTMYVHNALSAGETAQKQAYNDLGFWDAFKYEITHPFSMSWTRIKNWGHVPDDYLVSAPPSDAEAILTMASLGLGGAGAGATKAGTSLAVAGGGSKALPAVGSASAGALDDLIRAARAGGPGSDAWKQLDALLNQMAS